MGRSSPSVSSSSALALALLAIGVALAAPCGSARAQGEDPHAVAERVHRAGGYPSDVTPVAREPGAPIDLEGAGTGPSGDTRLDRDRGAGDRGAGDDGLAPWVRELLERLGALAAGLGGPLGWLLLIAAGALLLLGIGYVAVRMGIDRSRPATVIGAHEAGAVDPMLVGPSLSAEALAAEGRYREAIHALFLDALGRVGGREGRQRGRTARELVRALGEARAGRAALGDLLDVTELVWFGGRPATEAHYQQARALAAMIPEQRADRPETA